MRTTSTAIQRHFYGNPAIITCKDGFSFQVRIGRFVACRPQSDNVFYTHVEALIYDEVPRQFNLYRSASQENTYNYVPVPDLVNLINSHGGLQETKK